MTGRLRTLLPKAVLSPSVALVVFFVYGFILFTFALSFTDSKIFPSYGWVGADNYARLFSLRHWKTAAVNLAVFGGLYILISAALGLALAVFLDSRIRWEGFIRPIFLYPMALSFIVTGTAWKWMLDPGLGIENTMRAWGWESFSFNWIKDRGMAIYCLVIAAVWQSSGFVMAMFLAGLRGIDSEVLRAARVDGASGWRLYRRVVVPQLSPVFLSVFVVLGHLAIKSYDLVIALTGGGPGRATELPATFMYSYTFTRNQMGVGAASAAVMLATVAAIVVPYLYSESGRRRDAK